ncbi:hypothetical protein [Neorhizobium alkalisoli]|uniref:YpeB-like protein with protease inhibitory function n=1 Tax=Neorhizobium alkalisoli TaxID=528178 RepID=A0A561QAJ2_9HYPH|nr:hypothetical protein [Neorhizobium alkalisoli]TWF47386.1 hypothetical protein FHW37_11224 [Neorhizobium alkalisoli]
MRKNTWQACALALSLILPVSLPAPAYALSINIQVGSNLNSGRAITCGQGQRLIQNRGFRNVRRIDCRGRVFVYHATRGNSRFEIGLSSRTGRVVDIHRLRRR